VHESMEWQRILGSKNREVSLEKESYICGALFSKEALQLRESASRCHSTCDADVT